MNDKEVDNLIYKFEGVNPHTEDKDIFVNYPEVILTKAERNLIAKLLKKYLIYLTNRSNLYFPDGIESYKSLSRLSIGILEKIARSKQKMLSLDKYYQNDTE